MTNLDVGDQYVNVEGNMVERDALNIAERLAEMDPNLYVICVDPNHADFNEAPFIIAEKCTDGQLRRIFEVWELNEQVIDRVRNSDTHATDVQAHLDWIMAQQRKEKARRYEERKEFTTDLGISLLKNKKSTFTYRKPDTGDMVTVYNDNSGRARKIDKQ